MKLQKTIESFWYCRAKALLLLRPLNWPFLWLVLLKRYLFTRGLLKSDKFNRPLLVVGNISVGGTGKTPFILTLAKRLQKEGIKLGIVSRGYACQIRNFPHQITAEDTAEQVGDEALMLYQNLNIPLVIDPKRGRGVKHLIANNSLDLVISDDGMQHYGMARDLEFAIIDASRQLGNQMILPFGPLREPESRLKTCDLVIQNGLDSSQLTQWKFKIKASGFVSIKTGEVFSLDYFKEKKVQALAAIGNPQRFFTLLSNFTYLSKVIPLPDHQCIEEKDLQQLTELPLIMTEKDAVKALPFAKNNWYYLKIEAVFDQELENQVLSLILPLIKNTP